VRIAYLADFSPRKLGTGETRFLALAREARARGHSLTLFCRPPVHPEVSAGLEASGARVEDLANVAAHPLRWSRRLAREFDVIQLNAIAPRGRVALVARAAWPAKVLFVDHISPPAGAQSRTLRSLIGSWLDQLSMFRVWQAAGVSRFVRNRLQRRFGLPHHRAVTMYGGVDTERFCPRAPAQDDGSDLRITVVAALIPEKGIDVLLRALAGAELGAWRLRIVGDGPDLPRLRQLAAAPALAAHVEFLGLRDDVDEILRNTDIMVHPAVWQEALGYTVLEGMASGCAVVATRTGGIPELIQDHVSGLLVEPGDVDALRTALRELQSPDLRAKLAAAGRATIVERFTLARNVQRTMDWFEATGRSEFLDPD
jgi:glycosyltransferase involved in cell wall biosynthesis